MISKRKLRERLLDICNGAGMIWTEECYFECDEGTLKATGDVIRAIERSFELGEGTRLRYPWRLKDYDDLDTMVELVWDALELTEEGD